MVDEQDNQQRAARFAPRDRQAEPGTRRIRASLLFLGLGVLLTFGTVLWLGLFNQQDEIRLEISDLKVDETGDRGTHRRNLPWPDGARRTLRNHRECGAGTRKRRG